MAAWGEAFESFPGGVRRSWPPTGGRHRSDRRMGERGLSEGIFFPRSVKCPLEDDPLQMGLAAPAYPPAGQTLGSGLLGPPCCPRAPAVASRSDPRAAGAPARWRDSLREHVCASTRRHARTHSLSKYRGLTVLSAPSLLFLPKSSLPLTRVFPLFAPALSLPHSLHTALPLITSRSLPRTFSPTGNPGGRSQPVSGLTPAWGAQRLQPSRQGGV